MNGKISQMFGLRNYHQHHQQNRFSVQTWKFVVDRLKEEFPNTTTHFRNVTRRLEYFRSIQNGLKMVASFIGKECSPIFAQRAFRGYRILQLHSKLWSYNRHPMSNRALLSFVILSLCKANDNLRRSIEDSELEEHLRDLEFIHELTAATVVCAKCRDRLVVDKKVHGVEYCHCPDSTLAYNRKIEGYPWVPFVETPDLLVWRRPHPDFPGLYIYKVYGYYDDISAEDFLDAQLDIEYRRQWDDTALKLEVVEKDVKTRKEIIYWEMKWPRMFTNRDYVFVRRHKIDRENNNMVIMSRAVTHPEVPEKKGAHRVTEYWSVMQIKGARGLSKPGVEFGLTYFDNPGLSLPQWLTNWAAMTGIPDFLDKQRNAARFKRQYGQLKPSIAVSSSTHYSDRSRPGSPASSAKVNAASPDNQEGAQTAQNSSNSDNPQSNLNSSGNASNSTNPTDANSASSSGSSQEGKNELLSQFFKEQILDVHS